MIRRHPLISYFVLAFGISWLIWSPLWLPAFGISTLPKLPYHHAFGALGPITAAFLVSGAETGWAGISDLLRRMVLWRGRLGWLAVASLAPVALFALAMLAGRLVGGERASLEWIGRSHEFPEFSAIGFLAYNIVSFGFGEETGWRGFALPRLQARHSAFVSSLLLTIGWAVWHTPLFFYRPGYTNMNAAGIAGWVFSLVTGSVLLTWLYNGSRGSILVVAIFHAAIDVVFTSANSSSVTLNAAGALITVGGAIVVVTAGPGYLSRHGKMVRQEQGAEITGFVSRNLRSSSMLVMMALVVHALLVPAALSAQSVANAAELIRAVVLAGTHTAQRWPLLSDVTPELRALYEGTGAPMWSRDGKATPTAALVVQQLELLDARGLSAADYDASRLHMLAMSTSLDAAASAELDVSLTVNAVRALRALRFGRVSERAVHAELGFAREAYDVTAAIREMTTSTNPSLLFDAAEPPFLHYHLLKNAMVRYRALAMDSSLQRVTVSGRLRPGGVDSGVPHIRRVLAALGDLPSFSARAGGSDSLLYDSTLVIAMKRFQLRQGFATDGIVGPATLARMRRPFAERVAQMALTLERWRWLPHTLGDPPPIIVNVPAFRLHAFTTNGDRESDLISMDVVVGDAFNHRTPVFSGLLQYLVFSPYWDVPPSITRREMLPRARRDRGYLDRGNYEVVSNSGSVLGTSPSAVAAVAAGRARIRQKPGPTNSLGGVKFIFPNAFNVYLHDTPGQSVFSRVRRDASHGCIRVSDPVRLATFLLRNQAGWDSTRIVAAMHQSQPEQINLVRRVPVHIVYATAVAREDGVVLFYDDIYGHDKRLAALLAKGYPYAGGGR